MSVTINKLAFKCDVTSIYDPYVDPSSLVITCKRQDKKSLTLKETGLKRHHVRRILQYINLCSHAELATILKQGGLQLEDLNGKYVLTESTLTRMDIAFKLPTTVNIGTVITYGVAGKFQPHETVLKPLHASGAAGPAQLLSDIDLDSASFSQLNDYVQKLHPENVTKSKFGMVVDGSLTLVKKTAGGHLYCWDTASKQKILAVTNANRRASIMPKPS